MDVLFQTSSASLDDSIRNRIRAKAAFWSYLSEMAGEIIDAYSEELTEELTRTTIRLLYPYYNSPEMLEEAKLLLVTIKLPVPDNYLEIFDSQYELVVSGKIKARAR